jgi:hypothetical protein
MATPADEIMAALQGTILCAVCITRITSGLTPIHVLSVLSALDIERPAKIIDEVRRCCDCTQVKLTHRLG